MTSKAIMNGKEILDKMKGMEKGELIKEILHSAIQVILEAERDEHVGVPEYDRSEERRDTRSGYKSKTISTLLGDLTLSRPQTRYGYQSNVLENYSRIDQSVLTMASEMYAYGTSTRKVERLLEKTIGTKVSSGTVSRANKGLDKAISILRNRELGERPVLIVDARFDKVRHNGAVRSMALMIVIGINEEGRREVLDFRAVESETGHDWKSLFEDLKSRGLKGVRFTISDDHQGLRSSLEEVFLGSVWQRCQTHISRNIVKRFSKKDRQEVASLIRDVFTAPDESKAKERLGSFLVYVEDRKSDLVDYVEETMLDGFAVFVLPENLRRRLRTTNMVERINQEIKRRTKVARIFPSKESYERCAGTILVHIDDAWRESNYRYLDVEELVEALDQKSDAEERNDELISVGCLD